MAYTEIEIKSLMETNGGTGSDGNLTNLLKTNLVIEKPANDFDHRRIGINPPIKKYETI